MRTVLLVEPDRSLAESIIQKLSTRNTVVADELNVLWAKTAQQAVQLADQNYPDVVVLELSLPKHNGLEFIYEFRSYHEWSQTPIIVFSMLRIDSEIFFKDFGVAKYLYKPTTSLQRLLSEINQVLGVEN